MAATRILLLLVLMAAFDVLAMPKIEITHDRNVQNLARVQISNETRKELICFVAIDGHKIKFRLKPLNTSKWYKATDTRFNSSHFSTWCDFIELYPRYQQQQE